MIRFACPRCGMQLSAPLSCAGRSSKCRACGQPVTVPPAIPLSDDQLAKTAPPAMIPNVPDLGPIRFNPVATGGTPKPEEPVAPRPIELTLENVVKEDNPVPQSHARGQPLAEHRRDRQRSRSRRNDDQAEQEGTPTKVRVLRRQSWLIRNLAWLLPVVVVAGLCCGIPIVGVIGRAILREVGMDPLGVVLPPNARCGDCGCEFHVQEVRNFNDAFRVEHCPRCGARGAAGGLLNNYQRFHGR